MINYFKLVLLALFAAQKPVPKTLPCSTVLNINGDCVPHLAIHRPIFQRSGRLAQSEVI